ncbi:unnamed protein product, partial [marine sediment metagenome]
MRSKAATLVAVALLLALSSGAVFADLSVTIPPQAGDANRDGSIDALDITKVEKVIAGLDAATAGADANLDGDINACDITKVERVIAGLDASSAGELTIHFIDVGQGDAILIDHGTYEMLIDGGQRGDCAAYIP